LDEAADASIDSADSSSSETWLAKFLYYCSLDRRELHSFPHDALPICPGSLARVIFDGHCQAPAEAGTISTGLRLLESAATCETLALAEPRQPGFSAGLPWRRNDGLVVLAVWMDEASGEGLERLTERAYSRLLTAMQDQGYPHMVRVWNYLADINAVEQQEERYRQFCVGRFEAFARQGVKDHDFPSACALGHSGGDLVVYLLASRQPPLHFENPRRSEE